MKVKLLDWCDRAREVEIGDLDTISCVLLAILSGDETLSVLYKNGEARFFDSSSDRFRSDFDGFYFMYADGVINKLTSGRFVNRTKTWNRVL